jgi:hypothetical protein
MEISGNRWIQLEPPKGVFKSLPPCQTLMGRHLILAKVLAKVFAKVLAKVLAKA